MVTLADLLIVITVLVNSVLGIVIYLRDRKNLINKIFSGIVACIVIWIFSILMHRTAADASKAFFWVKVANGITGFIPVLFLGFSFVYPKKRREISTKLKLFFLTIPIVFVILGFLNLIAGGVKVEGSFYSPEPGRLYSLFVIYFIILFLLSFLNLFKSYKESVGLEKTQIKYLFAGTLATTLIAIATNLIFPNFGVTLLTDIGPAATIIMVALTSYGILKHHLFDIRVIATELLVGLVSLVLLVELLLAESWSTAALKIVILAAFVYLGISLIRSVLKEIERRRKLEELTQKLRDANERLKRLDKTKSEFVSIASHQLRTPLTAVKGFISMLLDGSYGKLPRKVKDPIRSVFNSNERLIRLVNDLLNVSKIEAETVVLLPEKVSVVDVVKSVVKELAVEAKKKDLILRFEKPKSLPEITIDRDKIRQAVMNLVDNAIKYTSQGYVKVGAYVKEADAVLPLAQNTIVVAIKDTGEGMEKGEIERLFQSFSRGAAGSRLWTEGAGLGLYVAKKFVEMHGGKVWAESEGKKKGSTFFIELPIK